MMQLKIKFILLISLLVFANADVKNIVVSKAFLTNKIKIVDVRTPAEWTNTGIIKGAYTITFFNEKGEANEPSFRAKLNKIIKKNEQFAIICHTGTRTTAIGKILGDDYNIINLQGGMNKLLSEGYQTTPFRVAR